MKNASAYLKMKILGAIEYANGKALKDRIMDVSKMTFTDEYGLKRCYTYRTISTWYYRYKSKGIIGVERPSRSDKGKTRKITPEVLLEAINQVKPHFHGKNYNRMDLFRKIIEKGIIYKQDIGQTTFYRWIKEYDLLKSEEETKKKIRLAFAMQYANQLWQADTMYGPYVKDERGKPLQSKLIAFIDDASRVLCHGEFFFNENSDALIKALKSAFYKRGIPECLYVDNGSIYTCREITMICARLGSILRHAPLRDGAAKGKIERFFRTVRDQFLSLKLDLSSLLALNRQFNLWVEENYNGKIHSALGMKPIDRFAFDLKRIRFLEPSSNHDEFFFLEEERKVKKDNTFSFNRVRYQAPVDLHEKKIHIRFDRHKKDKIIVYFKSQRMGEAKKLDMIFNGILRRNKGEN